MPSSGKRFIGWELPVCCNHKAHLLESWKDSPLMAAPTLPIRQGLPWSLLLVFIFLGGPVSGTVAASNQRHLLQSKSPAPAPGPLGCSTHKAAGAGITYPFMPALFVFGDSYVDTGNLQLISQLFGQPGLPAPYGQSPDGLYNITGRSSNGMILPDYLSQLLGLSPLSPPILGPNASWYYGCNFAAAGSGALRAGIVPLPLPDQTIAFQQFFSNATLYWRDNSSFPPELTAFPRYPQMEAFSGGLYLISTGVNDLQVVTTDVSKTDATIANVTASLRSTIQTLYSLGARNFLVSNIVNFGCIPLTRNANGGSCDDRMTSLSVRFDTAYQLLLNDMQGSLQNATFLTLDLWNLTTISTTNPAPLGFSEFTAACCGGGGPANATISCGSPGSLQCQDPRKYVFWDNIHFTTDFAFAVAKEVFSGNNFIRPQNLMQAFVLPELQAALLT